MNHIFTESFIISQASNENFKPIKVKFLFKDKVYNGMLVRGYLYGGNACIFLMNNGERNGSCIHNSNGNIINIAGYTASYALTRGEFGNITIFTGRHLSNEKIEDGYVGLSECGIQNIINSGGGYDIVKDYHTKVPLVFHRRNKEPLKRTDFFGIEIEYNQIKEDYSILEWMGDNQGFFHYEHDGSLDYGVESISQPFSELYYHAIGKKKIAELVKQIPSRIENNSTVDNGTGLHIHISRASLTDELVCKLYYFINSSEWREQIKLISGRGSNRYTGPIDDCKKRKSKDCKKSNNENSREGARYVSVNLENENTVEIRIFKSSNLQWRILGRIEFVMCLLNYLRLSEGRYWNGVSFDKFVEFAVARKGEYENLYTLLISAGLT